jgi:hypothetical protein
MKTKKRKQFTLMKNLIKSSAVVLSITAILFSCETNQNLEPSSATNLSKPAVGAVSSIENESLKNVGTDNVIAVGCEVYSLILGGNSGTPHIGGLDSYLANVNMGTGNTTAVSPITVGGVVVKTVTGITNTLPTTTTAPILYGVTGINSSIPGRLLKINPATGASAIVGNTMMGNSQVFLQDIEYCPANNRFYAILEGTSRILVSPNGLMWAFFASAPTNNPLNGLTFRTIGAVTTLWVIAGSSSVVCAGQFGDMWEFSLAAALVGTKNYKAANALWTNKELGLNYHNFTGCVARNFVVGSAMGFLSNNMTLCPTAPTLIGAGQVKPTYDFARR